MRDKSLTSRREFVVAGLALVPFLKSEACAAAESCAPTATGAGGPFYRKDAPWRTKLCAAGEPGEPLLIAGRVTAADTCRPLKGVTLDVFQANAAGFYDNNDPSAPRDPARFHLRGRMKTDDEGRYHFETVLPGNYTDGGISRARHIHFRISLEGYRPLITECYFNGEARNRTDPLVREPLILKLANFTHEKERRKYLKGAFDIVLARAS